MKQIERQIVAYLNSRAGYIARRLSPRDFVEKFTDGDFYHRLHGSEIFSRCAGKIYFSLCGWNTPTTRSRINADLQYFVSMSAKLHARDWDCYLTLCGNEYPVYTREVYTIKGGRLYVLDGLNDIEVVPMPRRSA